MSGKRVEIPLPKGMPTDKYAYQMEDEAGFLYVMFAGGTTASTGWVLNLRTLKWAYEIPGYLGQTITSADARGRVYLIDSAELKRFDPRTGTLTGTGYRGGDEQSDKGGLGAGKGLGRFTDPTTGHETIVGGGATGDLWRYDTVTKTGILTQIEGLVGTPTAPRSLAKGPDGRIYGGGYFQGGFVAYDPATTKWTEYHFPHQIEGMATHNGKLYLGIYANAELWEYDPAQPFADGTNPKKLFDLKKEGQERPWTVVSAGKYVAIGTSPKNTQLNGAVTLYDPATGERRTWNSGLVDGANQIAALTYRDGILYGGSLGCCNPADGSKHRGQVFAHGRGHRRGDVAVDAAGRRGRRGRADLRRPGPAVRPVVRDRLRARPGERQPAPVEEVLRLPVAHDLGLPAAGGQHGLGSRRRRDLHHQRDDPADRPGHAE